MTTQSQPQHPNDAFPLAECTFSDIPAMYEAYNTSFSRQPTNDLLFPPHLVDPDVKKEWFTRRYEKKFQDSEPGLHFYKITDAKNGKVVAWMKWGFPFEPVEKSGKDENGMGGGDGLEKKEEEGDDDDDEIFWPEGANVAFAKRHYDILERWQGKYVVDKMYVAHFLCTLPEYQRKGLGTRLLKLGLDKADAEGRKTYIEASPDGYLLYLRLGFKEIDRDTFSLEDWGGWKEDLGGHVCMMREPIRM